jgi:hypothetical protein
MFIMAGITGAPSAMKLGGKVAPAGPKEGIYRLKVTTGQLKTSEKTGRDGFEFEFAGFKDTNHPEKDGKKVLSQTFWGPHKDDDVEKAGTMKRMMRDRLFKPFGVEWPKDEKNIEAKMFVGKDIYALIGPNSDGDRNEILAMAKDPAKLPKPKVKKAETKKADDDAEEES